MATLVKCQHCGKEIPKAGIKNHEKSCKKKQEELAKLDPVEVVETPQEEEELEATADAEEIEAVEPQEEVKEEEAEKEAKQPVSDLVPICPTMDLNSFIAGKRYQLFKDTVVEVPVNVKRILAEAGMLKAI